MRYTLIYLFITAVVTGKTRAESNSEQDYTRPPLGSQKYPWDGKPIVPAKPPQSNQPGSTPKPVPKPAPAPPK